MRITEQQFSLALFSLAVFTMIGLAFQLSITPITATVMVIILMARL